MKNKIKILLGKAILYVKDKEVFIDIEDVEKISQYTWNINSYGYVVGRVNKSTIGIHRLITGVKKGQFVDHRDRNRLNNQKYNLNIVTKLMNNQNLSLSKRNTSGYRGITYIPSINKYRVKISINKKEEHLGLFLTLEEAIKIRKEAEQKYYYNG